jgi:hypothetical protein
MTRSPGRPLVLVCMILFLSGSAAHATVRTETPAHAAPVVSDLREFLAGTAQLLKRLWEKSGSSLDPFGQPAPDDASGGSSDNGASLDPFGRT